MKKIYIFYISLALGLSVHAQNVGINTSTPNAALDVKSTGSTSATYGVLVSNNTNDTSLVVSDNGNVGVGTTLPVYSLDVQSSNPIAARFSGRVVGQDAVNNNEFVTKQQLQTVSSNTATGYYTKPTQFSAPNGANLTFFNALRYCKNLVEGGFSDWRIPTVREFLDLYKDDAVVFPALPAANYWLDCETYNIDNYSGFGFYFNTDDNLTNGSAEIGRLGFTSVGARALCVR